MKSSTRIGSLARYLVMACALSAVAGCDWFDSDSDGNKKNEVTDVTLNVGTAAVVPGGSVTFVATVVGGNKVDPTVTWSVDPGTCGAQAGSITSSGTYTAGNPLDDCQVTVRATSVGDPSQSVSATVSVDAPVAVTLNFSNATLLPGASQAFVATVTGEGSASSAVTWSLDAGSCGSAAGSLAADGLYTAGTPADDCQVTVTATSVADPSKSTSASVLVDVALSVKLDVTDLSLPAEGTKTFVATVTGAGSASTAVTWSLDAGTCGADAGTLAADGTYTAGKPATECEVTVTAKSAADPSVSASATITVLPPTATGWQTPVAIDVPALNSRPQEPQVATDGSGNSIAVWQQDSVVYAAHWDGTDWSLPVAIDAGTNGNASRPQVGFDGSGNAIAVWTQWDGFRDRVYANRWDGTAWGTAAMISSAGSVGNADLPQLAVDPSGAAIAMWEQYIFGYVVVANYFDGTQWGATPVVIGSGNEPQLAFNGSGKAMAAWYVDRPYPLSTRIYTSVFEADTWSSPAPIDDGTGDAFLPDVAMDATGAIVVWKQWDGSSYRTIASRWAAGGWSAPETVSATTGDMRVNIPRVAMDGSGNAVVIWIDLRSSPYHMYANTWNGSAWAGVGAIDGGTTSASDSDIPGVSMDAAGRAMAIWIQRDADGWDRVYTNRWDGNQWLGPQVIDAAGAAVGAESFNSALAMDASGKATAVWVHSTVQDRVYAAHYVP